VGSSAAARRAARPAAPPAAPRRAAATFPSRVCRSGSHSLQQRVCWRAESCSSVAGRARSRSSHP
jgi:hypothetical protein